MKRKFLSVLSVLMAVLMSTAALTGCNKTPAGAENSSGSGESLSTEQGESSESGAQNDTKGGDNSSWQREALLKELNERYLPLYGILINCEEWASPEEIGVSGFYIWYAEYIIANTTVEERFEKYSGNSESGCWAFPAEEFEGFVQQYFNVSTDFLRSGDIYSAKNGWYDIGGADRWLSDYSFSVVSPDDISISGNTATAKLTCVSNLDSSAVYFYLSLDISEEPYKFTSCSKAPAGAESSEQKKVQTPINSGERGSARASCSDIREFVLSKEAAQLVLSLASGDFTLAEPCAYYGNIATYRISGDNNAAYCTFRIEKSDEYTVEALSCRGPDSVTGVESEFYPTRDDGYPEEAFAALALKDVYSEKYDFDSAEKVEYVITAVGSGQATAVEDEIRRMREAVESVRLLPIERFITGEYGAKFISNRFSYYKNADDEEPYCIIYTNLVSVETASGLSRSYYPENPEEYYRRVTDVYFAILAERREKAELP